MKRSFLLFLLTVSTNILWAQNELSNFSATGRGGVVNTFAVDYQSIGINPANLGVKDSTFLSFTLAEIGVGVSSQSLTRQQLRKFIRNVDDQMTLQEKQEFAKAFTNENALNTTVDITSVGISLQIPTVGGFGFAHKVSVSSHIGLNKTFAEILFLGKDAPIYQNFDPLNPPVVSDVFDNTQLQFAIMHEYNFAYGRSLLKTEDFSLYAGLGYKYIRGVGILDILIDDGKVRAYSALSPIFDVDYGNLIVNPNFNYETDDSGLGAVGTGHGFDLGFALRMGDGLKAGLSVTDLGSMEWNGNLITAFDQPLQLVTSNGISSFNIFEEIPQFTGSGDESLLSYQAESKRNTALPAKLRMGLGYALTEQFEAGLDVTLPLNDVAGNIPNTFFGAGIDFRPVRLLKLSTGFTAGAGNGFNIPLGITLVTKIYEAGVATRDITGYFAKENPYFSFAFGFLRFKVPV